MTSTPWWLVCLALLIGLLVGCSLNGPWVAACPVCQSHVSSAGTDAVVIHVLCMERIRPKSPPGFISAEGAALLDLAVSMHPEPPDANVELRPTASGQIR